MKDASWKTACASFTIEGHAVLKARTFIQQGPFGQAVDALAAAERIAASGCGHSGIACRHFAHSMCCIERPARFISPSEALHGASGFLKANDVMILASRGGQTSELLPLIPLCRKKGIIMIGVTENETAPIAVDTHIFIKMHVERESDPCNTQGTSSFLVLCAIFDALQVALLEETGFSNERFALIHPGGAVGERLNRQARMGNEP